MQFSHERLSAREGDDGAIILAGEIDIATAPVLESMLNSMADGNVVLDLRNVGFADSTGLRYLLDAARRTQAEGHEFMLRSVGSQMSRLLRITGTEGQFRIQISD